MKHKRLFVLTGLMLFISVSAFFIYNNSYKEELNYVVLGDSLSTGRNPYGVDDYGYADYVRDYLEKNGNLNEYNNYAVSGYLVSDVKDDIVYNRKIEIENHEIGIKRALRESDLVSISIGANDILDGLTLSNFTTIFNDKNLILKKVNDTIEQIEELLYVIKQYAKGGIVVIGYYNPFPNLSKYKDNIDEMVNYFDQKYEILCDSMDVYYVKTSSVISSNNDYLPNPLDVHPNKKGYEAISKEFISVIDKKILK